MLRKKAGSGQRPSGTVKRAVLAWQEYRYEEAIEKGEFVQFPIQDEQVYAFGRHTDKHKVIVLANFNDQEDKTYSLSQESLSAMGIETKGGLTLTDQLWSKQDLEISGPEAFGENGFEIKVYKQSAEVYVVESK